MAIDEKTTSKRVVGALSVSYYTPGVSIVDGSPVMYIKSAQRGDEIEVTESEEKRIELAGGFLPKGAKPEDAQALLDARSDAYRGERGDTDALARHHQRLVDGTGGIVNVDADVQNSSEGQLAGWITQEKPSADDTVALAENDPVKARKLLAAEGIASGQKPRRDVQSRLQKIIDGS